MIEWRRILPTLSKRVVESRDCGTTNFELDVVPGRARSVTWVQSDDLGVPAVQGIVSTTVTEIDPTDEGNVIFRCRSMTDEHQLLMVRSPSTNSFIEQYFAAGFGDLECQSSIFL
jgi:hypothetical protein